MKKYFPYTIILLSTLLLFAPVLINPDILLNRGNDLKEFFWPVFLFIKKSILTHHQLPFWNNVFFGGTPLLSDPQSFLFYLPNIIFLFLPMNVGFIMSFMLHTFFAGVGMYILVRKGLKLTIIPSLFASVVYVLSPKLATFLEAGHFGLVTSWTFLPFIIFFLLQLTQKPSIKISVLLSVAMVGLFFSHLPTFLIFAALSIPFTIYLAYKNKKTFKKVVLFYLIGLLFTFILSSPSLIPQLKWQSQTTRQLLLNEADIYPKWNSKLQFINYSISPGAKISEIDTEKVISVGIIVFLLSLVGFFKLKKNNKIVILLLVFPLLLISLNNASPIYNYLLKFNPFVLMRVATRFWTPVIFLVILLSSYGLSVLYNKNKKIALIIFLLAIIELTNLSWLRFQKPIPDQSKYVREDILDVVTKDEGLFRVFCLNRCISQKTAVELDIQLVEGYGTLQQKNYYYYFIQLTQTFFDRYSLALPPFEIYHNHEIQPVAEILGDFNVKYIISPHKLNDTNFKEIYKNEKYILYENTKLKPRAYFVTDDGFVKAPVVFYSPNKIIIDTSKHSSEKLILSEVYNPSWEAYSEKNNTIEIDKSSNMLREIEVYDEVNLITFTY